VWKRKHSLSILGSKNNNPNSTNSHTKTPKAFEEGKKTNEDTFYWTIFHRILELGGPLLIHCCLFKEEETEAQEG
jgi:hypothetical protein